VKSRSRILKHEGHEEKTKITKKAKDTILNFVFFVCFLPFFVPFVF